MTVFSGKRSPPQQSRLQRSDLHDIPKTTPASASAGLLRCFPRHIGKCLANEVRVRQRHQVISSRQSLEGVEAPEKEEEASEKRTGLDIYGWKGEESCKAESIIIPA
jgi:hypothetical protein